LEKTRVAAQQEIAQLRAQFEQATTTERQELTEQERGRWNANPSSTPSWPASSRPKPNSSSNANCSSARRRLEVTQQELQTLTQQRRQQLEKLSGINGEEARAQFLKEVEQESLADAANISRHILEDAKVRAEEKARKIIITAIQRYAGNQTFESSSATIILESPNSKAASLGAKAATSARLKTPPG
jgi:ribonuclease Y